MAASWSAQDQGWDSVVCRQRGRLALPPTGAHAEAEDPRFMINWDPGKQLHDKTEIFGHRAACCPEWDTKYDLFCVICDLDYCQLVRQPA